jgi:inosine-uridine nucleoside N-ribohydrolase
MARGRMHVPDDTMGIAGNAVKIPLVIDTDVALGVRHEGRPRDIDDGFAIVEAINLDALDLRAITTVYGNAPHPAVNRVANELVTLKGSAVPVIPGADEKLPQTGPLPLPNAAARHLAELLARQHLRIAAIGPLTNIALLAHHYPQVLGNIDELFVVAGRSPGRSFYIGSAGPVADFNFENDVRAMQILLDARLPMVFAGFELTSQVAITAEDLAVIAARGTDTARYLYDNSLAWFDYWIREFPTERGFHPWDSAAIGWLTHRDWFVAESRRVRILPRAGKRPALLECSRDGAHEPTVTYCTGFAAGAADAFVAAIVENVY